MADSFTRTEQRVIRALYRLSRWATANEIAKWADDISWNTGKKVLDNFHKKGIVTKKRINERNYWIIRNV